MGFSIKNVITVASNTEITIGTIWEKAVLLNKDNDGNYSKAEQEDWIEGFNYF
jgi:hypothetical protein